MIVKDDYSRYSWAFFLRNKSEFAEAFQIFLADMRDHGIPSTVESVRSDNGGEFSGEAFAQLCRDRGIHQEFTLPDTPKLNGVAERGLHLIQEASQTACLEALRLFPEAQRPSAGRCGRRHVFGQPRFSTHLQRRPTLASAPRKSCFMASCRNRGCCRSCDRGTAVCAATLKWSQRLSNASA